jgi:hypothetical protein
MAGTLRVFELVLTFGGFRFRAFSPQLPLSQAVGRKNKIRKNAPNTVPDERTSTPEGAYPLQGAAQTPAVWWLLLGRPGNWLQRTNGWTKLDIASSLLANMEWLWPKVNEVDS